MLENRKPPSKTPSAARIRAARQRARLSVADAARLLKVTPATLYAWERGDVKPKFFGYLEICEALGVQPDLIPLPVPNAWADE